MRAINGVEAKVRGISADTQPILLPVITRVMGIMDTMRIINGKDRKILIPPFKML